MKFTSRIMITISAGIFFMSSPAYAEWKDLGNNTLTFYPERMTYVDRADPLTDFGSATYLKIGDEALGFYDENGAHYCSTLNAARTYLQFSTSDFQEAFANYTINQAALHLYLSNSTDGASTNSLERINARVVTSADTPDYLNGFTWDKQASLNVTRGVSYAYRTFNATSEAAGEKAWISAGNATISQLIEGWTSGSIANYGIVLENDFDGGWLELINATKYSVNNPNEMNELEAYFVKGDKYPRLWVNVTPKVVPEPVSSVLMLVGFGVLGMASRRKKSK